MVIISGWFITRRGGGLVDGLDHGGDLVLADGSERLEAALREELEVAELAHLDVVRAVVGPDEVLAAAAEPLRRAVPAAVGEVLVVGLEHLLCQLRRGHHHRGRGAEPHRHDGPVPARPLLVAPAPHRTHVEQVAHHGPPPRPRGQLAVEEPVQEEQRDGDEGRQGQRHREEGGRLHGWLLLPAGRLRFAFMELAGRTAGVVGSWFVAVAVPPVVGWLALISAAEMGV